MSAPMSFRDLLEIEPLAEVDVAAVLALWKTCGPKSSRHGSAQDLAAARAVPGAAIFVARAKGGVVGVVVAGFEGHQGAIYSLAVDPCLQRNRVGTALVEHAEHWLQGLGAQSVRLQIKAMNEVGAVFFRKLGYAHQGAATFGKRLERV